MKTYVAKESDIKRKCYLVDAKDRILGRLATRIAIVLMGKNKPEFTSHVDCGDNVVVINAEKLKFTGRKVEQKEYDRYSGYPGGRKVKTLKTMLEDKPSDVLYLAVKNMLPKNKLGRKMLKKLRVCVGEKHPFAAQKPEVLNLPTGRQGSK